MEILSKKKLAELAKINENYCTSIYIPTHRAGVEVHEYQDAKLLKSHLDKIKKQMKEEGATEGETENILQKGFELVEDGDFWHHQWNGLALFLTPEMFEYFKLPYEVEEFSIVSQSLYLKPLIPAIESTHRYYILGLSIKGVRLYHADEYYIHEIDLKETAPKSLQDILKYYDFEKNTFGRPGSGHNYKGQGEEDEPKDYLKEYFKAIHDEVADMIAGENKPVVLACVDYMHPIFKDVNQKLKITKKGVEGSPDELKPSELHKKSWEIVGKQFEQDKENAKLNYMENLGTGKASYDINEVLNAAYNGRVQALILSKGINIWGKQLKDNGQEFEIHQDFKPGDYCLASTAALQVLFHGGEVYIEDPSKMPDDHVNTGNAAVFRY